MSIRKLYFRNAAGQRWGLNGENGAYASELAGFGLSLTPVFGDLSRGFFVPMSDEAEPQASLAFTITFTRNPYTTYQQLVNWLAAAGTVSIVYDPDGRQEYYRDVTVNFLQKGELDAVGWLPVPSSFFCSTPWYLPFPTTVYLEAGGIDESKRYDITYTADLRYGADSSAALSYTILGAGHIPASIEATYHGALINPRIRLTGNITGKTYGICSLAVTLLSSDTLKLSTRYEDSYVKRIAAGGVETDLLDVLDLTTTPFFHIPVSEPCTISVEADAPFSGLAELTIYYYYRSV